MITSTTWIGLSRIIRLIILNTPTRLSLSADILPKRASKSEVSESSFRRRRITEKIILVATICSFSTRTIGHPKRFQLHLTTPTTISGANWTTMNWEKWSKRSRLCNLASWRGRLAIGNGEGQEIFPGECWHHVRLLILFHRQLRSHPLCSSSGRPQFPCPIYHSLLPPPLATKLNADKETWEAAAITSMRGACSTNWNYCPINAGKPAPQAPPSSDVPTPSINPSPSAPLPRPCSSSTKGLFVGPPGTGRISFSQSQLVLSVVHPHVSLLVVSMMKPNYVVTEVSGASLVVQALRKASCSGPVIRQNWQNQTK